MLLLEMNKLTSGSTWHAAGNCPNFSGSRGIMKHSYTRVLVSLVLQIETGWLQIAITRRVSAG